MPVREVDNAMRVVANEWADDRGLAFHWDNGAVKDPHAAPTLVWRFRPGSSGRLTGSIVQHDGEAEGRLYVPAGAGALVALQHAEALQGAFRGLVLAGARMLDESSVRRVGREGPSYRLDARIPWELEEVRVPLANVAPREAPGLVAAYQAFRGRWKSHVLDVLSLKCFFDNSPPEADTPPPWALVSFRTLQPVSIDMQTLRVPGRVIAALNYPSGSGVSACDAAIATIERAFDECSFRGITFGTPEVNRVGRTAMETWQANVRLPFHYEVAT